MARTKHLAKVASQVAKPDGIVAVAPEHETEFLEPLPVGLIWGVGPTTERRLHDSGIDTIGQLAKVGSPILAGLLGEATGTKLAALSVNVDERAVETPSRSKSMGAQAALGRRAVTPELVRQTLGLPGRPGGRPLATGGPAGRRVTVRVRFPRMRSVTRSVTLSVAISTTLTLTEVAVGLAESAMVDNEHERDITLLAVSVSNLHPEHSLQLELPVDAESTPMPTQMPTSCRARDERPQSDPSSKRPDGASTGLMDAIREKFGRTAVGYASDRSVPGGPGSRTVPTIGRAGTELEPRGDDQRSSRVLTA